MDKEKMRSPIVIALAVGFSSLCAAQTPSAFEGSYVGGSIGAAKGVASTNGSTFMGANTYFTSTDPSQISTASGGKLAETNFSGGIFGGYGKRFDHLYLGLEASLHSLSLDDSRSETVTYLTAPPNRFTIRQSIKSDWEGTLRARFGVAQSNWLAYLTGGVAVTQAKYSTSFSDNFVSGAAGSDSNSKTLYGWAAGLGAEYMVSRTLSIRGEYLYSDFGRVKTSSLVRNPSFPTLSNRLESSADLTTYILSIGLAYRF